MSAPPLSQARPENTSAIGDSYIHHNGCLHATFSVPVSHSQPYRKSSN
jgi:hypothetical protein